MRKFLSLLLALVMVLCCIPAVAETADGVYEGTGAGLNGAIKVSVTVSGGKITEVKVLEHSETAGISDPAIEKIPAAIVEAQSADVDIVSGATFTSKGIIEAVKNALNPDEAKEATMPFEQPDILVIGAGMAGLATAARAAELGLNVLVVDQAATYGGSANVAGVQALSMKATWLRRRPAYMSMNLRTISLYGISMTVGMRDNRSMYTESLNIGFTVEVLQSFPKSM